MRASRTMGRAGVLLAALLSLALAVSACGGSETDKAGGPDADEPVVLTLANMDTDPTNIDSPDFIAAVERASGGSIRIDETHGWRSDAPLGESRSSARSRTSGRARSILPSSRRGPGTQWA